MTSLRQLDIKHRLILSALSAAILCYAAVAALILLRCDWEAHSRAAFIADVAARDLESQAERARALTPSPPAPGLGDVASSILTPGLCIEHRDGETTRERVCRGSDADATAPMLFALLYGTIGGADESVTRTIPGAPPSDRVVVRADPRAAAAAAWRATMPVLGIVSGALALLCGLLAFALHRVLRPTRIIRDGLQRLADDDLTTRMPPFDLGELSAIGTVFNRLAERLGATLAERDRLTRRLLTIQDDERRALARDLHDEFGQCLAAAAAMLAGLRDGLVAECPALARECDPAARVLARMQTMLRDVLLRLRPPDLDELGLVASLRGLAALWGGVGPSLRLEVTGDASAVPSPMQVTLYRIAQEAVTNAARHARAREIVVRLETRPCSVSLAVEDDGPLHPTVDSLPPGHGLLGMHERAAMFGGRLDLSVRSPAGHMLRVDLPMPRTAIA